MAQSTQDQLARDVLIESLVENVQNTSDAHLLAEVAHDYGYDHALATKFDQALIRASRENKSTRLKLEIERLIEGCWSGIGTVFWVGKDFGRNRFFTRSAFGAAIASALIVTIIIFAYQDYVKVEQRRSMSLQRRTVHLEFERSAQARQDLERPDAELSKINEEINREPNNAFALYVRGVIYAKMANWDDAIKDFTQAIQLDPRNALAFYTRGLAYVDKKDYDHAIADYYEAVRLNPEFATVYAQGTADSERRGYDYERAIGDYNEAVRISSRYADAFYDRGLARRAKGDLAGADADIATAKRLNPNIRQ